MAGVSLLRVENGRIVEERVLADLMGAMQQLGVLLVPEPARLAARGGRDGGDASAPQAEKR